MSIHGALCGFSIVPVMFALCTSVQGAAADDEKYLNDRYSKVVEVCPSQRLFVPEEDFNSGMYPRYEDRINADSAAGYLNPEQDGPGDHIYAYTLSLTSPELYLCSGLMVRGTRQVLPEGLNAWDPYPQGRTADTSFSYMRADIKMTRLAWSYTNGFIITPTPALKVNCFYPLDAGSDQRLNHGCGPFADDATADPQCGENATMSDDVPARARCRYDLGGRDGVAQFAKGVAAAARASRLSDTPNDLKVETWKPGCDQRLQIRAFFYVSAEGKPFAERDRKQYEDVCKKRVALVHLKFPGNKDGRITFTVLQ
ncbi:hypothetical protein ACX3YG_19525 [Pseudomonas wadenswilerensis]